MNRYLTLFNQITLLILIATTVNACSQGENEGNSNGEDSRDTASFFVISTSISSEETLDVENNKVGNNKEIAMITPYAIESDMASINEAFSSTNNSPWGFEHRRIDFFPEGNLKPFQAVCSGVVDTVDLWQLESTANWQVSVRLICNSTYTTIYAFEPMTAIHSDGETQLANILVSEGQLVAQGDIIGYLISTGKSSHVDFGLYKNGDAICPEPYFSQEATESILRLIHIVWPDADMCY